MLFPFL